MSDLLEYVAHLPEVELGADEVLLREGEPGGRIWVLVSGSLRVMKGDLAVSAISEPGSAVGEMSVLLGTDHSATVEAIEPSKLRYAADGLALLDSEPAVTRLIATGMAQRLATATTYLADLEHQYGDHAGLAMVSDVLRQLGHQTRMPDATPGSARDPDPEY